MAKVFDRVIIVMPENTMRASALANPYLNKLRKKGVLVYWPLSNKILGLAI